MIMRRAIVTALISGTFAIAPRAGEAQQFTRGAPVGAVSAPVILDTTGLYLERAATLQAESEAISLYRR